MDETKVSATLIDATLRWFIDGNFTMKKAFAALFVLLSLVASTQAFAGRCQHDSDTAADGSRCGGRSADSARVAVAFVKNKAAKAACDMSRNAIITAPCNIFNNLISTKLNVNRATEMECITAISCCVCV